MILWIFSIFLILNWNVWFTAFSDEGNLFAADEEEISLRQIRKKHKPWALVSGLRLTWVKLRNTRKVWQYWAIFSPPRASQSVRSTDWMLQSGEFFNQIWVKNKFSVSWITHLLLTGTIQIWWGHNGTNMVKTNKKQQICGINFAFQASLFPSSTMQAGQLKYIYVHPQFQTLAYFIFWNFSFAL